MYKNQLRLAVKERRELLSEKIVIAMQNTIVDSDVSSLTLSELELLWIQCQKVKQGKCQ